MCGIVGGVSERNVVSVILEGLHRLEYRGYDSVGIAVIDETQNLIRMRSVNRVTTLMEDCKSHNFKGNIGIGHTRWATHGGVTKHNAHPHFSHNTVAVVHNGIIENYSQKKIELKALGYEFVSETDTEVIAHLVHFHHIKKHKSLLQSIQDITKELVGGYALGVISQTSPNEIICISNKAPLTLGVGINEMYFASDVMALLPVTNKIIHLEDGDIAVLKLNEYSIYNHTGEKIKRSPVTSSLSALGAELGKYRHFMQKEIFEQPLAISDTLQYLGTTFDADKFGAKAIDIFKQINCIQIIACGTSYNAGMVAKYWFEEIVNFPCSVDIASEYRYKNVIVNHNQLFIFISQSGETADTLACIKHIHELNLHNTLAICNVAESSITRLSTLNIITKAGVEIGVASTKAFSTQLITLLYLSCTLAKIHNKLSKDTEEELVNQFNTLPAIITKTLSIETEMKRIAQDLKHKEHLLLIGRNVMYPIALEGALKIKEISYIHAESYASGELKHGPLSLIDKNMPIICLAPSKILYDKTMSNIEEVLARHGIVYILTDNPTHNLPDCHMNTVIDIPSNTSKYLLPIIYVVPLQLLAYHTALAKGTDVDKPRNLAKSVTVE